ncbi:type III-B CRISPR-associated protein Cas10/Cmr2 [Thermotoga sp. SG1]|uniref:type III-B CRISPR-associated protein Cas10/Cmr2 n=1 Tax=Thermotoga sp. SG1 TaxID=126739 RepID=UPI000C781D9A|nr:type III-B CRISPR-associated protein Cas10/Cmr2 [Thermotoga sp. SG1]PLV57157.1 type III-B CRISPR-associated protein Cas10/Cmr2 [Thermotoga sp. SG1]
MNNREEFWKSKISALFHDPITKAFDVIKHEEVSKKILQTLEVEPERGREDPLASAMDRFPIPYERIGKQIYVSFAETVFVHPFTGEELNEVKDFFQSQNIEEMKRLLDGRLKELKEKNHSYEKLFHALWWNLPYLVNGSQFLPADTRIANHSIIDHLDVTSALKGCLEGNEIKASLIAVAIGPVQEIISQARKARDLWAGSYLLSYLIYAAIETVGKKYGFDSIISPYLRGNYFVEKTLNDMGVYLGNYCPVPSNESVASLPNLFVAIVPESEVKCILEDCEKSIKDRWKELTDKTKEKLKKYKYTFNEESFNCQVGLFPDIQTASVSFSNPDEVERTIKKLFVGKDIEKFREALKIVKDHGGYKENSGAFYRYFHQLLSAKLAAKKAARSFPKYEENIYPGFPDLMDADDFGAGVRACVLWEDIEKVDKLGTLNAVKRLLPEIIGIKLKFDSTTDIAKNNEANQNIKDPGKFKNGYIGVLLMDGDQMGKWMFGEKAPPLEKVVHPKVKDAFERNEELSKVWEILRKIRTIQPAYHRGVSRTLGIFSQFVSSIVEKHKGMLIYSGGDDVLALLPADSVLECANKLRKFFSGKGVEIEGKEFVAKDGILYLNGEPFAPLMGENTTMSAGIAVVHHKFPLQVALKMARAAERQAKNRYGRNAFCISHVKRSGQMIFIGSKWEIGDMDVVDRSLKILEDMENKKVSHRSLYKLLSPDYVLFEEYFEKFIEYVLKRSIHTEKDEKKIIEELKDHLKKMVDFYMKDLHFTFAEAVSNTLEFLITFRTMKRGEVS